MNECKTLNIEVSPKLMSIKSAARYLGVTDYFLRTGVKNGTVPFVRSGCKYYIAVDVLMESLRQQKQNMNA